MGLRKEEEIAAIDAEISRIEEAVVLLVKQRSFFKRKRNSFSPAVNFPPELLALVFEYACLPKSEGYFGIGGYPEGQSTAGLLNLGLSIGIGAVTPLFLGMICSDWRKVALGSSQLWDSVTIRLNEKHAKTQARLLRSWLTLARQRPLWIKVVEDDASGTNTDETDDSWGIEVTSTAVIDILASFSSQWHTVDMFLPSSWKGTLSRIRHDLPALTSLTLRTAEGSPTLSRIDLFSLAPKLQSVNLVGYSFADIVLPWARLEKIEGEYMGVDESLDTLRLCTSLRKCQFMQQYKGIAPFIAIPLRHEQLRSFELILDSAIDLQGLLGAMTLPHLQELVLSLSDESPLLSLVMSLIRRSGCASSLTRLHLVGLMSPEDELLECLKELSSLEALLLINPVMTGGKLTERFLGMMNPRRVGQYMIGRVAHTEDEMEVEEDELAFLPRLRLLEYQGITSFSGHSLLEMLASRWHQDTDPPILSDYPTPPRTASSYGIGRLSPSSLPRRHVAQLKSVTFTTAKRINFSEEDTRTVRDLVEEGVHLELHTDPNRAGPPWEWGT